MPLRAGTEARLPDLGCMEALPVQRLRAAGAVIFGKANMHEIALGATGENLWTGDVKNPHDPSRQSGGSSSGSGVCVATGIGLASLGSDTGGSVRIPASFCGVVGFKPSFGAIPLTGALNLSWTCDHAGPIARSVDDAALLFGVMAQREVVSVSRQRRPRFAVPRAWLDARLHEAVHAPFERLMASLRDVADVIDVPTPNLSLAFDCYTTIVRSEAAFVHRAALAGGGEGFSRLILEGLQAGMKITAVEYLEALRQRDLVRAELDAVLAGCDAMLLPASAIPVPLRGQEEVAVAGRTMTVREAVLGQTLPFSLCGLPALSLPLMQAAAMPLGLQVVGAAQQDLLLLSLGNWLERRFRDPID